MNLPSQSTPTEIEELRSAARHWEGIAKRYREVHDRSPDGVMIFQAVRDTTNAIVDFDWLYCNTSAGTLVGRRPSELLGKHLLVEMPGNKQDGLFDIYVRVVDRDEPHSHEFSYQHEGLAHWFRSISIKLGDGFHVVFTDLTARKHAEEQAARLSAIVRSSEHAIYSTSDASTVDTWNQGAVRLYGYTSEEMIGQSILSTIPERCRAEHEEALQRMREHGGVDSFQTTRLTKAGTLVQVSIMLSPILDLLGRSAGTAVIARDVSEQVKLQERLRVADRMVSVGTLAAGMAHEINNPLAAVTANLEVAIEELRVIGGGSPSGPLKELEVMALAARDGAERIQTIVRGLMTFSRAEQERRVTLDVTHVLDLCVSMAANEVRQCAQLVRDYGAIPAVLADEARLSQVFINLLVNAAHAIGQGAAEANEIRIVTSTDRAGRAVIEVRDTGAGIPTSEMARIFDAFFTTKPVGTGIGLGLSICRNIVDSMHGEISVANNAGPGATFRIVLPPALQPAAAVKKPPAQLVADSIRRAAVLIVDDEPSVAAVLGRILCDHDVTIVTKAQDALALIVSGMHFDVILSDIMMPGMSGMVLHAELTRQNPQAAQRMVFITGGVFSMGVRTFLDGVGNERMDKPFEAKSVRALVTRLIGERNFSPA